MTTTYTVSARKYRPTTFASVVGQDHITETLRRAIVQAHVPHALLFCGPRGVGKTTCARIVAKAINCTRRRPDGEPCNECASCESFIRGQSYNYYELDAASHNSVEDIRALVEQIRIPPQGGTYKAYVIDEVHMLSQAAFNAFLKTLEEPPGYAVFILATTEKHKILPTILSRCQIFDFSRIGVGDMVAHLQAVAEGEGVGAEEEALHVVAEKAEGALRDALSMFDRLAAYAADTQISYQHALEVLKVLDETYFFRAADQIAAGDSGGLLLLLDDVLRSGFDAHQFLIGLAGHFRQLFVARRPETLPLLEVPEARKQRYGEQARNFDPGFLLSALSILNQADIHYKEAKDQRLHVEMSLLKLAHLPDVLQLGPGEGVSGSAEASSPAAAGGNQPAAATTASTASAQASRSPGGKAATSAAASSPSAKAPQPAAEPQGKSEKEAPGAARSEGIGPALEGAAPTAPASGPSNEGSAAVATPAPGGQARRQEQGEAAAPPASPGRMKAGRGNIHQLRQSISGRSAEASAPNPTETSEAAPVETEPLPSLEAVKEALTMVAAMLKDENKRSLSEGLLMHEPELSEGPALKVWLDSKPLIHQFNELSHRIGEALRERLGLSALRVTVDYLAPEEQPGRYRPFTDKEKYEHMVARNPEVEKLKERFKLSFR